MTLKWLTLYLFSLSGWINQNIFSFYSVTLQTALNRFPSLSRSFSNVFLSSCSFCCVFNMMLLRGQRSCATILAGGGLESSCFVITWEFWLLHGNFFRCKQASFSEFALLALMEACVCEVSLRRLRVTVTLKVCVYCSSILSSSDTLMRGHQAKAWRKPARNLKKGDGNVVQKLVLLV